MAKKVNVKRTGERRVRVKQSPIRRIDPGRVDRALGAEPAAESGRGGSPIGLHALRRELHARLRSSGGRPSLEGTSRRQKVPLSDESWEKLERIAQKLSEAGTSTSPGQVAAVLLEQVIRRVDEFSTAALRPSAKH